MADQQLEALSAITAIQSTDEFLVNDKSDTTDDANGSPKKVTAASLINIVECTGRLTLATGTYVTTADQTGKSTLYLTGPEGGNFRTWLYDGTNSWTFFDSAEISLALTGLTSGKPYDVFLYDNSGTPTLELTVWTDDTTRATALTTQDGVTVKTGATTRRYLGTLYTTGTTTTEDSVANRYLWNYHNRRRRKLKKTDTTSSWTYNSTTWRAARGQSGNKVSLVVGVSGEAVNLCTRVWCDGGAGPRTAKVGIGKDWSSGAGDEDIRIPRYGDSSYTTNSVAHLLDYPAAGQHDYTWLEAIGGTTGTAVSYYGGGASGDAISGLLGEVMG